MARLSTLWHYTDAAGLHGIVSQRELWFGDARLLNDQTEQSYAEGILAAVVSEEQRSDKHGVIATALASVDSTRHPIRLYVCSFSETSASLSQWQRYGADGNGYCIGFNRAGLERLFGHSLWWKKMQYKPEQQKRLIRRLLQQFDAAQNEWPTIDESALKFRVLTEGARLGAGLDDAMLQMKHPLFADEREWRYILMKDAYVQDSTPSSTEKFVVRSSFVKPYVPLPPKSVTAPATLPIEAIVCGPKLNFPVAQECTRRFVTAHGYAAVQISQSELAQVWR